MKATAEEIGEKQKIFLDEGHPYVNETYIREVLSSLNLDIKSMNTNYTTASPISRYTIEATITRITITTIKITLSL